MKHWLRKTAVPALLACALTINLASCGSNGGSGDPDSGPALDVDADMPATECAVDSDCDDGNPCTLDACTAGQCVNPPDSSALSEPCSDGDPCTTGSSCLGSGVCGGGDPVALPEDPCILYSCDAEKGITELSMDEGSPCDDGNCCTLVDTCLPCDEGDAGCTAGNLTCQGNPKVCGDTNECTTEACECQDDLPVCVFPPLDDGTPCDAALTICTTGDSCQAGECTPGPEVPVDDGNPCTLNKCEKGEVLTFPLSDPFIECDDGKPCTLGDHCVGGACIGGAPMVCVPPSCADGAYCLAGECIHQWLDEGTLCDDGNACTMSEMCDAGNLCTSVVGIDCNDSNPCTSDWCDPLSGTCKNEILAGQPCDDGSLCTDDDQCQMDGGCQGEPAVDPLDPESCFQSACNPANGLFDLPKPDGTGCEFDDPCGGLGECLEGQCVSLGGPCQGDCLTGACTNVEGVAICQKLPDLIPCDDGNPLSPFDQCIDGQCVGWCGNGTIGDPCDPDNDICEANCGDSNACNGSLVCAAGICVVDDATVVVCPQSQVACNENACMPATGECQLVAMEDGLSCVSDDLCLQGAQSCSGGFCLGGDEVLCDDDNICTEDSCVAELGCVFAPIPGECDDGDLCTLDDECVEGQCVGVPEPCPIPQGVCMAAMCVPATGECVVETLADCCGNGLVEEGEECDDGNAVEEDLCSADCLSLCTPECEGSDLCVDDGCGAVCDPCPAALAQGAIEDFVVDGGFAYLAFSGDSSKVGRVPLSGGAMEVLATAQVKPRALALKDDHLYWVAEAAEGAEIRRAPLTGGVTETLYLTDATVSNLAVSSDGVYFWQYTSDASRDLVYVPLQADGEPAVLASDQAAPHSRLLQDENAVFWHTWGANGAIHKVDKLTHEVVELATAPWATQPALYEGYLYYSTGPEDNASDAVVRVSVTGGSVDVLASSQINAYEVQVAAGLVFWYWGQATSNIRSVPVEGGDVSSIAHLTVYGGLDSLATDGYAVYWIDSGLKPQEATVHYSVVGSKQVQKLALDQAYATAMTVHENSAFWLLPGLEGALLAVHFN